MRRLQIIFLTLVLVLGLQVAAQAIAVIPTVDVTIGTDSTSFGLLRSETGWYLPETHWETTLGSVNLMLNADTDPFITMAIGAVNFAAGPVGFAFGLAVPIALPAVPTTVSASLVGGLTDSTGNGVAMAPLLNPTILWNTVVPPGFAWGTGPAAAFGPGVPGAFYPYLAPAFFGPGPVGGAMLFAESISFTLTGGSDAAALTGFCSISPIPVPPTLLLMGTGLLGLAGWRRWRKI